MKKILIAALTLLMINGAMAQDVRIGIKAGGNLSTLTNMQAGGKMKFGFHIGGFVDFKFNDRLSLQPELLFSAQGLDWSYSDYTEPAPPEIPEQFHSSGSFSFGYINVPVLLKINLPEIAKGFSAEIGPQIGFLVSARASEKSVYSTSGLVRKWSASIRKDCNLFDIAAVAGLSYSFAENFVVSARYGFSLTKIWKEDDLASKNNVIQLSVGYKF